MKVRKFIVIAALVATAASLAWLVKYRPLSRPDPPSPTPPPRQQVVAPPKLPASSLNPKSVTLNLPISLRPVFGLDGHTNFWARLAAVHQLDKNLNHQECQALYKLVRTKPAPNRSFASDDHVLKNDILDVLCRQAVPPTDLGNVLTEICRDSEQETVMRDYALQHLVVWLERLRPSGSSASEPMSATRFFEVFWDTMSETNSSIAGTALLGLRRLAASYPTLDRQRIARMALRLVEQEDTGELSRITAIQVCAEGGVHEALPAVLGVARYASTTALQISAVAALGSLGGAEEVPFLKALATNGPIRLRPAARTALLRMEHRSQKESPLNNG